MNTDLDRGTGRTTNMLKQAAQHQKENPNEIIAIVCANQSQSKSLKSLFVKLGGNYMNSIWLNYVGGEISNSYKPHGFEDNQVFIDHYVYEKYRRTESIKWLCR